jgi:hypothetical protein
VPWLFGAVNADSDQADGTRLAEGPTRNKGGMRLPPYRMQGTRIGQGAFPAHEAGTSGWAQGGGALSLPFGAAEFAGIRCARPDSRPAGDREGAQGRPAAPGQGLSLEAAAAAPSFLCRNTSEIESPGEGEQR